MPRGLEREIGKYSPEKIPEKRTWDEIVDRLASLEEWREWIRTEGLDKFMEEVNPEALDKASERGVLFRSMDPKQTLGIIREGEEIKLRPNNKPNATSQWEKAMAYGGGKRKFNCVLGFWPENLNVEEGWKELPEGLPEEARRCQFENYIVSGDITPKDMRYLMVRFSKEKLACYRIDQEKFEECLS